MFKSSQKTIEPMPSLRREILESLERRACSAKPGAYGWLFGVSNESVLGAQHAADLPVEAEVHFAP